MGRIRQWWNRLVVAPETAPEEPAARIAFRLAAMTPLARKRAEALRREAAEDLGSLDKVTIG